MISKTVTTEKNAAKDPAIITLRMIAMALIVITHLALFYGKSLLWLWHVARVGTPLFFLMSGYLYGQRNITSWGAFYYRRWKSLMLPIYLWVLIMGIVSAVFSIYYTKWQYITYIFNLSGIPHAMVKSSTPQTLSYLLTWGGRLKSIAWGVPLWFMTYLMICLFLIPVFQLIRNKFSNSSLWCHGWIMVLIIHLLTMAAAYLVGINICYIGVFAIGYFVNRSLAPRSCRGVLITVLVTVFASLYLLGVIRYNWVGLHYVLAQTIIVCGILGIISFLFYIRPNMKGLPDVGNFTYCVYITHFTFLTSPFIILRPSKENFALLILPCLLFFVATFSSSMILKYLSNLVLQKVFANRLNK